MVAVLFVCLGNICRSPAAEGILRHLVEKDPRIKELHIQSCGIGDWHVGQHPDERMRDAAKSRGITLSSRAQQFKSGFLDQFDYILAADKEVLFELYQLANNLEQKAKMSLMTSFSSTYHNEDIPDPYYSPGGAFDLVLDMIEDSCNGLIDHILKTK